MGGKGVVGEVTINFGRASINLRKLLWSLDIIGERLVRADLGRDRVCPLIFTHVTSK